MEAATKEAPSPKSGVKIIEADPPVTVEKNTIRSAVAKWVAMRALDSDLTNIEIAKRLGLTRQTLQGYLTKATREGWLKFDDPLEKIEHEVIPMTVDNLIHFLSIKDKTVTIEAAKGTIFKTYLDSKGVSNNQSTVLALKIEMPDGKDTPIVTGQILGKPRQIEESD